MEWYDNINSTVNKIKKLREPEPVFDPKRHKELGVMNEQEKKWFSYMHNCEESFQIFKEQIAMRHCVPTVLEAAILQELQFRRVISFCVFWGSIQKRFNVWNEELCATNGWKIVIESPPYSGELEIKVIKGHVPEFPRNN